MEGACERACERALVLLDLRDSSPLFFLLFPPTPLRRPLPECGQAEAVPRRHACTVWGGVCACVGRREEERREKKWTMGQSFLFFFLFGLSVSGGCPPILKFSPDFRVRLKQHKNSRTTRNKRASKRTTIKERKKDFGLLCSKLHLSTPLHSKYSLPPLLLELTRPSQWQ